MPAIIGEYGFDQQGWYGMFVACGIWCLADVSSVSPSSEGLRRSTFFIIGETCSSVPLLSGKKLVKLN